MAFVKSIEFDAKPVERRHPSETRCFVESGKIDDTLIVAISTTGSAGRVSQEHRSQTIQLGEAEALQLHDYLGRVYGIKR